MFLYDGVEVNIVYQPKYCLINNKVSGLEALTRTFEGGLKIDHELYLSNLNNRCLINDYTILFIESSFLELNRNDLLDVEVSFNIYSNQLLDDVFVSKMLSVRKCYKGIVTLEISEKEAVDSLRLREVVMKLKCHNIKISLDDFAKDSATICNLLSVDYDEVKVDKSLIDMLDAEKTKMFIKMLVGFASDVNLKLVAEGVESQCQVQTLKELGVDFVQGYFFAKPTSACELALV
ncbi:EAL domain-containing protein [Vibrio sp. 10N.222.54.A1]|jgi:EAL domain-containing protein (putative c-di-GMP-specific phosphodiesterase class I)|uniref:EAL domain-containing protein n=3 Tax=Vibrio TaxID=662 RepID=A0A7Z1MJE3_9VIBR|nr:MULTISPECIES: EAL domain-containing protein [Vibrio]MCW8345503.1 EAL domain-containing protein [Vibrio qingdaonensis]PMK78427.1 hypothetical protein BCT92_20515 [Vibrio sp. 10N.261.52.E5]PMP25102.1 hypothetical protein BCS91_12670 [Vibrio cyclitrophicus]PMP29947.1 hypothetical protein BCS90_00605 [Vibrio cyclitrophicus]TKF79317.1 EAL domain-containing protein [Vibrio sp. F13]